MPRFLYFDLRPRSGFRLPLSASALWGHLAWAVRELEGDEALEAWLSAHESAIERGEVPPLQLSSAFPRGFLPRPLLPPSEVEDTESRKGLKALGYVPLERLPEVFRKGEAALLPLVKEGGAPSGWEAHPRTRVAMDRRTGAAAEGLLFEEVLYWSAGVFRVYVRLGEGMAEGRLGGLLDFVGQMGYGGGSSVGNGVFKVEGGGEEELPEGRGPYRMLLGPGLLPPRPEGWWRVERYWGRLGPRYASAPVPFKRPYLRVVEGSVLKNHVPRLLVLTPSPPPEDGIRVLENLAPLTLQLEVPNA